MKASKDIHIGTSGWHYEHWRGPFYPEEISNEELLSYYAKVFHTVEINNSFYRLPTEKTFKNWRDRVPDGFIFSVKASRYITHTKKLKDPQEPVANFMKRVEVLEDKLGPILFQLPPRWRVNPGRLREFLEVLPEGFHYAFEFRDSSWFDQRVVDALADQGAAFCIYHLNQRTSPKEVTADFVYIRLHGPDGAYQGKYDISELSGWAGAFSTWERGSKEIYCYFDNDERGYAAEDALKLKEMVED